MTPTLEATGDVDAARQARVRRLLLVSAACVAAEVFLRRFLGDGEWSIGAAFSAVMLWLVYRRHSRVARGIAFVLSATGAVVMSLAAYWAGDWYLFGVALALALAYVGQAAPLLAPAVRRHVQRRGATRARTPAASGRAARPR